MKKDFNEFKQFIKNKKVAVVGIGVSNIPLIEFLNKLGAIVTAFDKKEKDELTNIIEKFKPLGVEFKLGEDYLSKLRGFDVVFKTPSMRIDSDALTLAKEQGAYITSEMEEFIKYCPAKIYGITGSDGKTTTTTLIYNILKQEGYNTWVGGNIGTPLFSKIEEISKEDRVVLELSSFQLMTINERIDVAVITNLSPNHLDMHKDLEEYLDSKKNIYKYQDENCLLILNEDNEVTKNIIGEEKGKIYTFSINNKVTKGAYFNNDILYCQGHGVCQRSEVKLIGMYNIENLLAAFAATSDEVSINSLRVVAMTFNGVEHRNEFLREINGVKYYNNSIATSPTRVVASIKAFEKPIIVIAGGYDKNLPFEPLAFDGYPYIKSLILLGATKEKIAKSFDKLYEERGIKIPIYKVETLDEAIKVAQNISEEEDVVALSPACAAFDMFTNFAVRGNEFKRLINEL